MEKKEFNSRLREIISMAKENFSGAKFETVNNWFGAPVNVFQYAATSEHYMERQLREFKGEERKTTFMADLSMGEWYGLRGLLDTVKNAVSSWCDDVEYMAEFVLCLNWKAWEHDARKNTQWTRLYSFVYESVYDLIREHFAENEEESRYLWTYLD